MNLKTQICHSDLVCILHEWGHALHALTSKAKYQHISGIRGPPDTLEVASTFMEHFAWDRNCLSDHFSIPDEIVGDLVKEREIFEPNNQLWQICLSLFDMHSSLGISVKDSWGKASKACFGISCDLPKDLAHFVTYGANYYSYVVPFMKQYKMFNGKIQSLK
jgi:Zn-dependent oligopeptidase